MPRQLFSIGDGSEWLDIVSYGRRGPARRDRLSPAQVATIARTVRRTPEVMVKVLNQGGTGFAAVRRHIQYLDRGGELEIETDDGEPLQGRGAAAALLDDWDLDLDAERPTSDLKPWWGRRKHPKLVQKLMFSMPAGTPSKKVLAAVKHFAREEFALKHRYAMVLHTDEPHPHVHVVVKTMGQDGRRLNIRHATLREWRREFARHLREQGVAANATERAVRGVTQPQKTDGIYRAGLRGVSTHWWHRANAAAREMAQGGSKGEPGRTRLLDTRRDVGRGWNEIADKLVLQGEGELAQAVRHFVRRLPPARTEREWIREDLLGRVEAPIDLRVHGRHVVPGGEQSEASSRRRLGEYWRGFGPVLALRGSTAPEGALAPRTNYRDDHLRPLASLLTAAKRLRARSDTVAAQFAADRERSRSAEKVSKASLEAGHQPPLGADRREERTRDDRGQRTR